jgi:hypothetical protein
MQLGTIVKSTTHVDYVCRVYGPGDVPSLPKPEDYAFGVFVRVGLSADSGWLVGLIHDTILLNPEFGQLGPRLSPPADLEIFSPDYLNERAALVSIVAVGHVAGDGRVRQGVPLPAAALGAAVERMADGQVRDFHAAGVPQGGTGAGLRVAYFPLLLSRREPTMPHLLLGVIAQLVSLFPDQARALAVLRGNLAWKSVFAPLG